MKKLLFTALVALTTITQAHAQSCAVISPGWLRINHRVGLLFGSNFAARVSCSRNAPVFVLWRGGAMCPYRYFYGRNGLGQPFSCKVWSVWRR